MQRTGEETRGRKGTCRGWEGAQESFRVQGDAVMRQGKDRNKGREEGKLGEEKRIGVDG